MTSQEAQLLIASSLRQHRLAYRFTQQELSQRSGVALASLRKFERTGLISLQSLLKIAVILGILENIVHAVEPTSEITTMDQLIAQTKKKPRQRARR